MSVLQVFPRNNTRPPKLLERLQEQLASDLRAAERAACSLAPSDRNPTAAANLRLDVHRRLFDSFIGGFAAYKPILVRIKVCLIS